MDERDAPGMQELARISKQYDVSPAEIAKLVEETYGARSVPATLFSTADLTPLEAIIKWLHERHGMRFSAIAPVVGRDQRAVAITYKRAAIKMPGPQSPAPTTYRLPLVLLTDRRLSVFEHLVDQLQRDGMSYADIARITLRDQRTIWTIANRAKEAALNTEC